MRHDLHGRVHGECYHGGRQCDTVVFRAVAPLVKYARLVE